MPHRLEPHFPAGRHVLPVTRELDGDQTLSQGGVTLQLVFRQAASALVADTGGDPSRGAEQRARIVPAYHALKAKYGSWHGFEAMFIPQFLGGVGGTYVGH